ncbi:Hypothetical predicted protein [Cloeon dipterum]|uniref:Uncharacterized protein n=1 Tax=Cloeon dipterum TaxID=197152 RepID=A0A8S1CDG9_9INSE|nr:Hypothetical predicted protein [Cloeon dipterum]
MLMTKFVAANVGNYIHGKLTLENLPFSLREMVLHQLMQRMCRNIHSEKRDNVESVDCMIQAYLQLVGVTTKKIELGGFISLYLKGDTVQNVTKILEAISQKATNLEHLDFQKNTLSQCFHYYPCLEKNSVEAIIRLEYLKIIHFSRIEYINVKLVCKNLKKLQYVECIRLEFTEEEEEKDDIEADIEEFKK